MNSTVKLLLALLEATPQLLAVLAQFRAAMTTNDIAELDRLLTSARAAGDAADDKLATDAATARLDF